MILTTRAMKMHLKNAKKILAATLLLAILATQTIGTARASDPIVGRESDHTTFTTGTLQATFEGNQPQIKFSLTTDTGHTEYDVRFKRILEFNDTSGKGIFLANETITKAELEVSNWIPTLYSLKDGNTVIGIAVNFTNTIPIEGSSVSVPVTFVAKAYNTTQTLTLNGKTVTVESAEIKIDFIISNWPFGTEKAPRLALQVNLHSEHQTFETEEGDGAKTISNPETSLTTEQQFKETDSIEQEVRFSGAVGTTGMIGFFRFVNTATTNGQSLPVLASYKGEQDSENGGTESELAIFLSYPQFTGTLVHDPSFGFTSTGIPLLYFMLGGAAIVVVGLAVLLRRTRPHIQVASL